MAPVKKIIQILSSHKNNEYSYVLEQYHAENKSFLK